MVDPDNGQVMQTAWFRSIKNYHNGKTVLDPAKKDPHEDDVGCAWVFSRLFKSPDSTAPDIQPRVRNTIHPDRFRRLTSQNLSHLVRHADQVANLRDLDKHLTDSAVL